LTARLNTVIESSIVVRAADVVIARVRAAAPTSRGLAAATRVVDAWTASGWRAQRQALGLILMIAPAAHVLLSFTSPRSQPGWMWLIVPGISGAIGALLVAASGTFDRTPR
jgi:uncharacterized membrane protein HdeD (DUF308 family)